MIRVNFIVPLKTHQLKLKEKKMDDPNNLKELLDIGMTEREARLYLAMLQAGEADATQLHRISGVVRTKTYEALQIMVLKGYCLERVSGKRRFFRAVKPSTLREIMIDKWKKEMETKKLNANRILNELQGRFDNIGSANRSFDFIEVIRNTEQNERRFISNLRNVQKEVLALCRSPYLAKNPQSRDEQQKAHNGLEERGVINRAVYMMEEETWPWLSEAIMDLVVSGQEVRISKNVPMKMYIFDRKIVHLDFPLSNNIPGFDYSTLLIEDERFTDASLILFETIWENGFSLKEWDKLEKRSIPIPSTVNA